MEGSKTRTLWERAKHGRTLSQLLFFGLTAWVGYQMVSGVRGATVEKYCPFGGVETLIPWINKTGTLCSLSTMNISILVGVLVLTLVFKRVFCSHICPMGALLEWTGALGKKLGLAKKRIPPKVDAALKWVKYPLLILILGLTIKTGELIFRGFDPYYVIFTANQGHGIGKAGLWVTGAVLVVGLFSSLAFCKYLCPMGACLAPFSRLGLIRITRNEDSCTSCGNCDKACAWGVKVSTAQVVKSAECSNCQDCLRSCPADGALTLGVGRVES
jgi:polyferredoxin